MEADANANGTIDTSEFLRQMRLLREGELTQARVVFESMSDESSQRLSIDRFEEALQALDQVPGQTLLEDVLKESGSPKDFDFKQFVHATDRCRKLKAELRRVRAGFSDEEYLYMRGLFEKRCKPGSKELEKGELLWFLVDFEVHVSTLEERRKLFERLEIARTKALEAGVEEADAGKAASPTTLHVFLHFLQAWRLEKQQGLLEEEEKVMDKARFSLAEVQEFRTLFMEWVKRSGVLGADDTEQEKPAGLAPQAGSPGRRSSLPNIVQPSAVRQASKSAPATTSDPKAVLSAKYLMMLLASIGLQLNSEQRVEMDGKLRQIMSGTGDHGLDFGSFLLLMRWMLDSNFADINGASKKAVERVKQVPSPSASTNVCGQASPASRSRARRSSI